MQLNPIQTQDARARLLEQRDRILRLRRELRTEEDGLLLENAADDGDRSATVHAANALEAIGNAEYRNLLRIEAALCRLNDGTWGLCEVCGSHIDRMRLAARPEAELCSDCSTV